MCASSRMICFQQHIQRSVFRPRTYLQVAEHGLRLDVEHLGAVVHYLCGAALRVRCGVDVLVEVLQVQTQQLSHRPKGTACMAMASPQAPASSHTLRTRPTLLSGPQMMQQVQTGWGWDLRRTQKMVRQILFSCREAGILEPIQ